MQIARATQTDEFVPIAYFLHLGALAELGLIAELDRALSPTGDVLSAFPWLEEERHVAWFRCLRATIDGQTERAEQLAGHALAVAVEHGDPDAQSVWVGQLAIIRWMQGRVVEFEPAFLHARQISPHEPVWAVSLAWMWLQQGRTSAALAIVSQLPPVRELARDRNWLATACILAVVASTLGEKAIAVQLRDSLLPFEERLVMIGLGVTCWGTVARPLALIALALGETEKAIEHYRCAIDRAARAGAHPWLAEAQTELAALFAAGSDSAQHKEGTALASEAAATCRALQLRGAEDAAAAVLATLKKLHMPTPPAEPTPQVQARPTLKVLGTFEVISAEGEVARWQSRKARTLIKILVAKRGLPEGRETLMHLLWPDEPVQKLANRFSVAVATVRRAFDPGGLLPNDSFLEIRDSLLRLCVERIDIDVETFLTRSQTALSPLIPRERAIDLLRDALESAHGDAWAETAEDLWAEELRREVNVAVFAMSHSLAECSREAGDELTRIDCYRRILALDGYDQRAHEGLIDALMRVGATSQAAAARKIYARHMDELGIASFAWL